MGELGDNPVVISTDMEDRNPCMLKICDACVKMKEVDM